MQSPIDPRLDEINSCLYRLAVKALVKKDGKFLVIYEAEDHWWSFPGGGVDYGETLLAALDRELHEELGIPLGSSVLSSEIVHVNIGTVYRGVPRVNIFLNATIPIENMIPTKEVSEYRWVTAEEFTTLDLAPTFKDDGELVAVLSRLL